MKKVLPSHSPAKTFNLERVFLDYFRKYLLQLLPETFQRDNERDFYLCIALRKLSETLSRRSRRVKSLSSIFPCSL